MKSYEIARLFERMADVLELKGENPFRIRAYRRAAHHHYVSANGRAAENRFMCDLLHRGIVPPCANATDSNCGLHGCMADAA